MKAILFVGALLLGFQMFSQDQTKGYESQWSEREQATVLLVPYEQKMFLSDVSREIGNNTGLELAEIERLFREGTCQMISNVGSESYQFIDLLNDETTSAADDMEYIFNSIQWKYEKVPPPPTEKTKTQKWLDKVSTRKVEDQRGRGVQVEEGEIETYYDEKQRFMDVLVLNDKLVPYLVDTYDCDFLLFINELDIKVLRDFNRENGQTWDRMVKIHYSILNRTGEKVFASAAYYRYSGHHKEIWGIIRKNLEIPAREIISKLPMEEAPDELRYMRSSVKE